MQILQSVFNYNFSVIISKMIGIILENAAINDELNI